MTNKKGFTLIELLIVISIMGILATLVIASMAGAQKQARDAQRKSDLGQYRIALESYAVNKNGLYPNYAAATNLTTICTAVLSSYMAICTLDDSDTAHNYKYASNTDLTKYIIYTGLEKGDWTTAFFYFCSTGKNGEKATAPTISDCP